MVPQDHRPACDELGAVPFEFVEARRLEASGSAEIAPPQPREAETPSEVDDPSQKVSQSQAAITVQKVYRSYRTRRQLADDAVMKKDAWWKVVEAALLRENSETFYSYERPDTAVRRWTRLKKKAAKVGKGLSKDKNARKLAIQHWLEAIDPKHRYGHNLHFYYDVWGRSLTKEPFFYWLDVGEGREVDLPECKRSKLLKQQIEYLGPKERKDYEVVVDDGKLRYRKSGELVNTPSHTKWIFVMSTLGKLYVAEKKKGTFQHSSFLAGGATKAAGRLLVNDGVLELMEAHSGHYHPTQKNFSDLVRVLEELGTDLSTAKVQSVSDDMLSKAPSVRASDIEEFVQTDYIEQEVQTECIEREQIMLPAFTETVETEIKSLESNTQDAQNSLSSVHSSQLLKLSKTGSENAQLQLKTETIWRVDQETSSDHLGQAVPGFAEEAARDVLVQ